MTFEDYWARINLKRPIPYKGKVVFTAEQLKDQLRDCWIRAATETENKKSVFERIFGR